jgi:hypothetical protein
MKDYGSFSRHKWAVPFEVVMAVGGIVQFIEQDWLHLLTSVFTFTVSFVPLWFERIFKVRLPALLQFAFVAFVFLSMFCGEVFDMYARVWQWDDIIHFSSGLLIGLGSVVWITALVESIKNVSIPRWLQSWFVFSIVSSLIVLWELVEFGSDQIFSTTSQGSLYDTMMDLLYGALGGAIISVLLVLHLGGRRMRVLDTLTDSYKRLNK